MTIRGLNAAAAVIGTGVLVFDEFTFFSVKYGCLLWQLDVGEFIAEHRHWLVRRWVQPIAAERCTRAAQAEAYLAGPEDGDPVPYCGPTPTLLPTKVHVWALAANEAGLQAYCKQRVPEMRTLLLRKHQLLAGAAPTVSWIDPRPQPAPVPAPLRPLPVRRPPELRLRPAPAVAAPQRVEAPRPAAEPVAHCLVCCEVLGRKPHSTLAYRYGWRHKRCIPPPAVSKTLDGEFTYRDGGYRRPADGVWVCPPGTAVRRMPKVTVVTSNMAPLPKLPLLDDDDDDDSRGADDDFEVRAPYLRLVRGQIQ
jgi:hypothetical protein